MEDGEPVPAKGEDYTPNLAGKRAAYSAAWQNEKGKFSDVEVYVIP
jgi:hypothetical protein